MHRRDLDDRKHAGIERQLIRRRRRRYGIEGAAIGSYNTASTTVCGYLNVAKDGSAVEEWNREAPKPAGSQYAGLTSQNIAAPQPLNDVSVVVMAGLA